MPVLLKILNMNKAAVVRALWWPSWLYFVVLVVAVISDLLLVSVQ